VAEIRLDARLTRPGALLAGAADGRVVLVRVLRDAAAGEVWVAAHAAGLPVPAVELTRCAERPVLDAEPTECDPLDAATPVAVRAQAAPLARSLAAHGIAARLLQARDLAVSDGTLVVRAPVEGSPGDVEAEAAALAATVEGACAGGAASPARRWPRRGHVVLAAACAMLAVVLGIAHGPGSPSRVPRTPAAQAAPLPMVVPVPADPVARPPATAAHPATAPPRVRRHRHRPRHHRRPVRHPRPRPPAPPAAPPPRRIRPAPPVRPHHRHEGGIAPAGGHADPVPVL
jgi:hypothetical protein